MVLLKTLQTLNGKNLLFIMLKSTESCTIPLGLESGLIKDSAITASSSYDASNVGPQFARYKHFLYAIYSISIELFLAMDMVNLFRKYVLLISHYYTTCAVVPTRISRKQLNLAS